MSHEVTPRQETNHSSEAELTPVRRVEREIITFQKTGIVADYLGFKVRPEMAAGALSQIVNKEKTKSYLSYDTERLKIAEEFIHNGILYGGPSYIGAIGYMERLVEKYR